MNIDIRKTGKNDIGQIVRLMLDFAEYEKLTDYCEITEDKLNDAIFGSDSFVESLVALDGETPIGYAIYFPYFASFRGQRGYYLEDIFIDAKYRGQGVGEAMLKHIARQAKSRGFERIDFQVLDWNEPAIKFYEKFGAEVNESERHFKFSGEAFERLAMLQTLNR